MSGRVTFDHWVFGETQRNFLPRTALINGIVYLALQAFPIIFGHHGFDEEFIGLSFLGIGVGMILATLSQPFWNRY